jgi:hypothetical protein
MKIFVSFVQQASLLAIVSKFIYLGGGVTKAFFG